MKDLLRRVAEQSLSDLKVDEQVEEVKLVREKKVKRDEAAQGLPSVFQRPIFATEGPLEKNSLVLLGRQFHSSSFKNGL